MGKDSDKMLDKLSSNNTQSLDEPSKDKLLEVAYEHILEISSTVEALEAQVSQQQQDLIIAAQIGEALVLENGELQEKLKEERSSIAKLESSNQLLTNYSRDLLANIASKENTIADLNENQSVGSENEELRKENDSFKEKNRLQLERIEVLRRENIELRKENSNFHELEAKAEELEENNDLLKQDLGYLKTEEEKLKGELEALKASFNKMKKDYETLQTQTEQTRSQNNPKPKQEDTARNYELEINSLNEKISNLQVSIKEQETFEALKATINQLKEENARLINQPASNLDSPKAQTPFSTQELFLNEYTYAAKGVLLEKYAFVLKIIEEALKADPEKKPQALIKAAKILDGYCHEDSVKDVIWALVSKHAQQNKDFLSLLAIHAPKFCEKLNIHCEAKETQEETVIVNKKLQELVIKQQELVNDKDKIVEELRSQNQDLAAKLRAVEEKLHVLESTNSQAQIYHLEELEKKSQEAALTLQTKQLELDEAKKSNELLQRELEIAKQDVVEKQELLKVEKSSSEEATEGLRRRIAAIEQEAQGATGKQRENFEQQIAALRQQNQVDSEAFSQRIETLQSGLQKAKDQSVSLEEQLRASESEREALALQKQRAKLDFQEKNVELDEVNKLTSQLREQLAKSESKVLEQQELLSIKQKNLNDLRQELKNKIAEINQQSESAQGDKTKFDAQIKELTQESKDLEKTLVKEIEDTEYALKSSEQQSSLLRSQLESQERALKGKLKEAEEKLQASESSNRQAQIDYFAALEKQSQEAVQMLKQKQLELDTAKESNQVLQQALERVRQDVVEKKGLLEAEQSISAEAKKESERRIAEIEDKARGATEKQKKNFEQQIAKLRQQNQGESEDSSQKVKELEYKLEEAGKQYSLLEEKLRASEAKMIELEQGLLSYDKTNDDLIRQILELKASLENSQYLSDRSSSFKGITSLTRRTLRSKEASSEYSEGESFSPQYWSDESDMESIYSGIIASDKEDLASIGGDLEDFEERLLNFDDLSIPDVQGNVKDPELMKQKFPGKAGEIDQLGNLPIEFYDENGIADLHRQINESSSLLWSKGRCTDPSRKGHEALISYTFDGTHYRVIVAQEGRVSVNFVSFEYMLRQNEEIEKIKHSDQRDAIITHIESKDKVSHQMARFLLNDDDILDIDKTGLKTFYHSNPVDRIALNMFYQSKLEEIKKATNVVVANNIIIDKIHQNFDGGFFGDQLLENLIFSPELAPINLDGLGGYSISRDREDGKNDIRINCLSGEDGKFKDNVIYVNVTGTNHYVKVRVARANGEMIDGESRQEGDIVILSGLYKEPKVGGKMSPDEMARLSDQDKKAIDNCNIVANSVIKSKTLGDKVKISSAVRFQDQIFNQEVKEVQGKEVLIDVEKQQETKQSKASKNNNVRSITL